MPVAERKAWRYAVAMQNGYGVDWADGSLYKKKSDEE